MSDDTRKDLKILFLTRQFAPVPKVCEICVRRVREALYVKGIESDVLQFTGEEGLIEQSCIGSVYSIGAGKGQLNTTVKNKLMRFFKKAAVAYRWPYYYTYRLNRKFRRTAEQLNNYNHYDAIVGMALPVDTVFGGQKWDNFIYYELDAISNNPSNNGFIKSLLKYRVEIIERRVLENSALIIHMASNRDYFSKDKFIKYKDKTVYADIPNLIQFPQEEHNDHNRILLAYFGTLTRDVRNPDYLIKVLEMMLDKLDMTCEFYSRGNCEDILAEAEKRSSGLIKAKGYVAPDEVIRIQNITDFLLSIGNKLTGEDRSLPSKILEYIAIGKPVIHIYGGENDSAIKYLEKYGLSCILDPAEDLNYNVNKALAFISENKGKRVSFETVKVMFPENTPDYTASIIKNFLEKGTKTSNIN